MPIEVSDLKGIIQTTLSEYEKGSVVDIASDLTEYMFLDKLLPRHKKSHRGKSFKWNLMTKIGENAKHTALFDKRNIDISDNIIQGEVPWRFTKTSYAFDLREEEINSGSAEQLVDLIDTRRQGAKAALAVLMEEAGWGKPTDSSDGLTPYGIEYYIVKNATEGFYGGAPSGFSDVAGISPTTYDKWRNYTGPYTNVTKDDLILSMKKSVLETGFKTPMQAPALDQSGIANKYQIYMNKNTYLEFDKVGESQNDNLGRDVASMFGTLVFKNNPIIHVPYLDSDDENPVYMVNWNTFEIAVLDNWMLRETITDAPTYSHVVIVEIDLAWNTICKNRRMNAVFHQA